MSRFIGDPNQYPYIKGRPCEGKALPHFEKHYRVKELHDLARQLGLSPSGNKNDLCRAIRAQLTQTKTPSSGESQINLTRAPLRVSPPSSKIHLTEELRQQRRHTYIIPYDKIGYKLSPISKANRYHSLADMMRDRGIGSFEELIDLPEEMLLQLAKDLSLPIPPPAGGKGQMNRLRETIILTLAREMCQCTQPSDPTVRPKEIAECFREVFNQRGVLTPGYRCTPLPVLVPAPGQTSVLRQIRTTKR